MAFFSFSFFINTRLSSQNVSVIARKDVHVGYRCTDVALLFVKVHDYGKFVVASFLCNHVNTLLRYMGNGQIRRHFGLFRETML